MNFRVFMNCDNAAFDDHGHGELARILNALAKTIAEAKELPVPFSYVTLRDINGNDVGRATFSED